MTQSTRTQLPGAQGKHGFMDKCDQLLQWWYVAFSVEKHS